MRATSVRLQEALLAHRKLLVVGDPGSGKSTFLKRVAFQLCNEYSAGGPLPVRVEAAVLSNFIAQQHESKHGPADPTHWIGWSAGRIFSPIFALLALAAVCRRNAEA